jgi:glycogen synthase
MRILELTWEYPPRIVGGLARHCEGLCETLVAQGHEVHVLTVAPDEHGPDEHSRGKTQTLNGVQVDYVLDPPTDHEDFLGWVRTFNQQIREKAPAFHKEQPFDLVHCHDWLTAEAGLALQKQWKIHLSATLHATESGRMGGIHHALQRHIHKMEEWLTHRADSLIVCSKSMQEELQTLFQVPASKIGIFPNGIQLDTRPEFSPEEKALVRERYVTKDQKLILFVGRMVHEKGGRYLVEAMPHLLGNLPNAKAVLVGRGPYLEELQRRSQKLGVAKQVHFTGYLPEEELQALIRVADIGAFPSLYEPFGIVALEAMAAGVPIVVSDVGGLAEIVADEYSGLKVPPQSGAHLAWAILRLLTHQDLAQKLAHNAQQAVQQRFAWDIITRQTVQWWLQKVRVC